MAAARKKSAPSEPSAPRRVTTPPARDHVFVGVSFGEAVLHFDARIGFLEGYVNDGRVRGLYREWARIDDLGTKVSLLAAAYERVAKLSGLPGRAALFGAADSDRLTVPPAVVASPAFQNVMKRLVRRDEDLWATWDSLMERGVLIDSAITFTLRFDLPWDWLVAFTIDGFMGSMRAQIEDAELVSSLQVMPIEQSAPDDLSLSFATKPDETAAAALRRFRAESKEVEARLAAAADTGRIPKKRRESIRIYGRWLYESTLGGKSRRAIARDEFGGATDQASNVRYGLRRARELLTIGDQVLSDQASEGQTAN